MKKLSSYKTKEKTHKSAETGRKKKEIKEYMKKEQSLKVSLQKART